jgi:hypothetical protein
MDAYWIIVDDAGDRIAGPFDTEESAEVEAEDRIASGWDLDGAISVALVNVA